MAAVILILVAIGLVVLYSTSAYNGRVKFHDSLYYVKKQGFATLIGLFGMLVIAQIDYHKWVPPCCSWISDSNRPFCGCNAVWR